MLADRYTHTPKMILSSLFKKSFRVKFCTELRTLQTWLNSMKFIALFFSSLIWQEYDYLLFTKIMFRSDGVFRPSAQYGVGFDE